VDVGLLVPGDPLSSNGGQEQRAVTNDDKAEIKYRAPGKGFDPLKERSDGHHYTLKLLDRTQDQNCLGCQGSLRSTTLAVNKSLILLSSIGSRRRQAVPLSSQEGLYAEVISQAPIYAIRQDRFTFL
jgi:hypothetical protein